MNQCSFPVLLLSISLLLICVLQIDCQPSTENDSDEILHNKDDILFNSLQVIDDYLLRHCNFPVYGLYDNPSAQSRFRRTPSTAPPQTNYDNQGFPGILWPHKPRIPIAPYLDNPLLAINEDNPLHPNSNPNDADDSTSDQAQPSSSTAAPEDTTGFQRPILDTPRRHAKCMVAILNCCQPGSSKVNHICFEQFGCFGDFRGINPCTVPSY